MIFYGKLYNRKEEECTFDGQYMQGTPEHLTFGWVYLEESKLLQTTPHIKLPNAGVRTEML